MMTFFRVAVVALGLSAALLPTLSRAEPAIRYPSGRIGDTSAFTEVTEKGMGAGAMPFALLSPGKSLSFPAKSVSGDKTLTEITVSADQTRDGVGFLRVNKYYKGGTLFMSSSVIRLAYNVPVIIEDDNGAPVAAFTIMPSPAEQLL